MLSVIALLTWYTHTPNEGTAGSITPLCPAQLGQHTPQIAALAGTAELLPAQFSLINSGLHNTQLPCLLHSSLVRQDVFQLIRPTSLFSQTHWSILPASQGQSRRRGFLHVLNNHSVMDLSQVPRLTNQLPGLLFVHLLRHTSSNRKSIFICLFLVRFSSVLGLAGELYKREPGPSAGQTAGKSPVSLQPSVTSAVSLQWQRLITHCTAPARAKPASQQKEFLSSPWHPWGNLQNILFSCGLSQKWGTLTYRAWESRGPLRWSGG